MLAFKYLRTNLRAAMEYRSAFIISVFGMVLNNASFILFWLLLLNRIGGQLNGYGFEEIMYLWAVVSAGYGLSVVFFGNGSRLTQLIMNGDVDVYLLQPASLLPNILGSRMQVSGLGDLAYGIILFAFTQGGGLVQWGMYLLFIVLSMVMFTALFVLFHSLTFFLGNAEGTAHLATEAFISFSIYPGSVFKGPARWVLHSIIPVAWAAWVPAELASGVLSGAAFWQRFFMLFAVDGAFLALAVGVFYLGLRRYESGNRIGARM
jgi:ABC-2 type transport system permease protein